MAPSTPTSPTTATPTPNERLDVPTLPPPSSRFVLPPPPSDLLNRLQAFLPQIRDANAMLAERGTGAGEDGEEEEEAVVMEEISDDSDSDDSSDDSSDSSDKEEEGAALGATGETEETQDAGVEEQRGLAQLLDISSKSVATKKKLLVEAVEGGEEGEKEKMET